MSAADPGLFALKGALRTAIVVPVAFALSLVVIGDKQMALFAAFGSLALLVFVDFAGSRRARLRAYLALLAAGACLISLGTACSESVSIATVAMALVAFAILFAGALDGYVAAAQSAAMLTFVLPVMVPEGVGALPMRLAGWGLAGVLSIAALMLLWPARPRGALRADAARAARALAALLGARAAGDPVAVALAGEDARRETAAVRGRFLGLQHRPSGTASRVAALARLTDDLGFLCALALDPPAASAPAGRTSLRAERAAIEVALPRALRAAAARLDLGEERGSGIQLQDARRELARLRRAHEALGHALLEDAARWRRSLDEAAATRELDEAYTLRQLTFTTLRSGRDALLACGETVADDPLSTRRARLQATGRLARAYTSMRSVWLRNSVRGAAGLALAVLIGQLSDLQHAFWIVLGTMSVLRSNALATGATIARGLLGTLGGIVTGGLLVALVGDHRAALWAILSLAVLVAAYAPRAISFAAGQGAFSVVVLVLFNLLAPVGWRVGLVRVEDVAIGAGVSLLAGVLIWPRGATAVLREALGAAYARAAGYLGATIDALLGFGAPAELSAREATQAAQLLEATVHDYLAERSSARGSLDDLTVLLAGATRARLIARLLQSAHSLARLEPIDARLPRLARARDAFAAERREVCDWYAALGASIAQAAPAPAPAPIGGAADGAAASPAVVVLERESHPPASGSSGARRTAGELQGEARALPPGAALAWAHRHLQGLAEMEPALARACKRVANV